MKRFLSFLLCVVLLSGAAALSGSALSAERPKATAVRKVEITKGAKATMRVGGTLKLKVKLTPAASDSALTWRSSDTKVATVSDAGVVKAKKAGTANIVVKAANGKKDAITIEVKSPSNRTIRRLYDKKAAKLGEIEKKKYVDLTGDMTDEAFYMVHADEYGWDEITIRGYAYEGGKVKTIFSFSVYGLDLIRYYSQKKALVLHFGGHGYEAYDVYRLVNGKFRYVAGRSRESEAYGESYTSPWHYYDGGDEIPKKQYTSLTAGLLKGKTVRIY